MRAWLWDACACLGAAAITVWAVAGLAFVLGVIADRRRKF